MPHFLPSTERLYAVLQAELPAPEVHAAMVVWENALFHTLPRDAFNSGTWPAQPALLAAMRAALADQRGNYAGDHLAYCLVRCGCREPDTMAGLCAWDAQLFRWQEAPRKASWCRATFPG